MDEKELDDQIESLEEKLAKLKTIRANKPKPVVLYLHADDSSNFDEGKRLKLTVEQMDRFRYALYEVSFHGFVNADGDFVCETVNGVKLETPTVM